VTPASIVDASALLAYLADEPGAEVVERALGDVAAISTANWAEVLSKLAVEGHDPVKTVRRLEAEGLLHEALELVPLTPVDAVTIASLRPRTKPLGLSLADRACLALGLRLGLPILTTDNAWLELASVGIDVSVRAIR
jgi:PIN domain nuclease of toxin-antitoxin system